MYVYEPLRSSSGGSIKAQGSVIAPPLARKAIVGAAYFTSAQLGRCILGVRRKS